MKSIFTGTEQDLIECEFEKFDYDYVTRKKLKEPIYKRVGMRYACEHCVDVIQIKNNIITQYRCYTFHIEEFDGINKCFIQDLIDKNLVRFEKEKK